MVLEPCVPVIVPSLGSLLQHSLPSAGSRGAGSPASSVLRSAPTPDRPSRRASLPSLGGTSRAPLLRSRRRVARRRRAWGLVFGPPTDFLARRRSGLPGSWGTPLRTCPALRPRRDRGARPLPAPRCSLPRGQQRRLSRTIRLTGFHHTACTLPVYASQRRSPSDHATLGSGWRPTFAGRGWLPAGSHEKFPPLRSSHGFLPSQAFLAH